VLQTIPVFTPAHAPVFFYVQCHCDKIQKHSQQAGL